MTELVYTEQALIDLERLSDFLLQTDPQAAKSTAVLIFDGLEILVHHPEIGRKVHFGQRELVISRGRTGYLALYRFLPHVDRIVVLALRHQRHDGFLRIKGPSPPPADCSAPPPPSAGRCAIAPATPPRSG